MSSLYSFQAKLGLPFQVLNGCSPSVVRAKKLVFLFSKATKDTPGLLAINASLSVLCLNSKKYSAMSYYIVGRFPSPGLTIYDVVVVRREFLAVNILTILCELGCG